MAWTQYLLGGGIGGLIHKDYTRKTKADHLEFDPTPFNQERDRATSAVMGSAGHNARGAMAQLEGQGLAGVPGVTMAVNNQARQTSLSSLKGILEGIGSREERQMQLTNMINEVRQKVAEEKDEVRRARWGQVLKTLVSLGVTIVTGGAGAPLLTAVGAGTAAGAGMNVAMPDMPARTSFKAPEFGGLGYNNESALSEIERYKDYPRPSYLSDSRGMGGF